MSLRKILLTGLLLCSLGAHAAIISSVSSGTIDQGSDSLGLFGVAGATLDGSAYVYTMSFDTRDAQFDAETGRAQFSTVGPFTISLSVNGNAFTRTGIRGLAGHEMRNQDYAANPRGMVNGVAVGDLGAGRMLTSAHFLYGEEGGFFSPPIDFSENYTRVLDIGDAAAILFFIDDSLLDLSTTFSGTPTQVGLGGLDEGLDVPEPSRVALLGLGLLGGIGARRRAARRS